jgi:hypothetical protein
MWREAGIRQCMRKHHNYSKGALANQYHLLKGITKLIPNQSCPIEVSGARESFRSPLFIAYGRVF